MRSDLHSAIPNHSFNPWYFFAKKERIFPNSSFLLRVCGRIGSLVVNLNRVFDIVKSSFQIFKCRERSFVPASCEERSLFIFSCNYSLNSNSPSPSKSATPSLTSSDTLFFSALSLPKPRFSTRGIRDSLPSI